MPDAPIHVGPRRLLAYSADRSIWLHPAPGGDLVRKVFETGPAGAAEEEARLGASLGGPGFVEYVGAEPDPDSGRPSTLTRRAPGRDLWELVETDGPLPPGAVATVGVALCRVLERLHRLVVHRDVKPANVLVEMRAGVPAEVTLLDAEHAWPMHARHGAAFSGGTHGWSPPEAYECAQPTPAFDVFGLGATLWFAATGRAVLPADVRAGRRRPQARRLAGLPPELAVALVDCLAADPAARPELPELARRLAAVQAGAETPAERALDRVLLGLQRGDVAAAEAGLAASAVGEGSPAERARRDALAALLRRRRHALPPQAAAAVEAEPASPPTFPEIVRQARRLLAMAARFPAHPDLRRDLPALRRQFARALDGLAEAIATHKRAARFTVARTTLDAAQTATVALAPFGGRSADLPQGAVPSRLQRAPLRLIALARDDVTRAERRHETILAELSHAERELNVGAAAQAIDHAVAVYSGASEVVANLKDRLHRLTYFVERLAQPNEVLAPLVDEAATGGFAVDLAVIEHCFERCRGQSGGRVPKNPLGLRALQRTLRDLAEELPATEAAVGAAEAALSAALGNVSENAWAILDDCRTKLAAVPIPIRPLQNLVARLDHLRLLDALVDSRRGTRAELLDEVERVRSDLDQARTTRDRIASGAREAMERGHLTTALYDMARAVDRYDAPAAELEEARKRKHAVEEAVRENHRLAARYAELEDDASSAADDRIEVLEQRRRVLEFLTERVAAERATNYAQDRLDVEVRIVQERAADAERRIDTLTDPAARLALAHATLADLEQFASDHGGDLERLGRVQRLREHWGSLRQRSQGDVAQAEAALRERGRRRRRSRVARSLVGVLTLALAVTTYFLVQRATTPDAVAAAAAALHEQLTLPYDVEAFDPVRAVIDLERFAGELEHSGLALAGGGGAEVVRAARALADTVGASARDDLDLAAYVATLRRQRADYAQVLTAFGPGSTAAAADLLSSLRRFEAAAEVAALLSASRTCRDDVQREVLRAYARERRLALRL